MDVALVVVRLALAWVFLYYGAAKLFGWFPDAGPNGLHQTALYMSQAAELHPGMLFAVLAGVTEFGGGVALALGLALGALAAAAALLGAGRYSLDAMISGALDRRGRAASYEGDLTHTGRP